MRRLYRYVLLFATGLAVGLPPAPAAAQDPLTLDRVFKGRVSIDKKKVVTVRYDFRDASQLKDWENGAPLRVMGEVEDARFKWFDGAMQVPGTRSVHHVAEWTGDVSVTATYRADGDRDIGCWIAPSDGGNDYCTFTLKEHYFHYWDGGNAGGSHSIIQFGDQWREGDSGDDYVGFRYVARRPPPDEMVAGRAYTFEAAWEKSKFHFRLGKKFHLKGKHPGRKLQNVTVGFYTVVSRLSVDDVVIRGKLTKAWLEKHNAVLEVSEAGSGNEVPAELQLVLNAHKAGKLTATTELVTRLGKGGDHPAIREAMVEALSSGPKQAVRPVIELLYHSEETVRDTGIGIVKSLLGKDFGFRAKAKEARRSASIKKLNDALDADPGLLED